MSLGRGDTVIATQLRRYPPARLMLEAAALGIAAAGIVVGKVGTGPAAAPMNC